LAYSASPKRTMRTILLSPAQSCDAAAGELTRLGVRVIRWPTIVFGGSEDDSKLDQAIENLFGYDWLILKNEAAGHYFFQRFQLQHQLDELDQIRIVAIGAATELKVSNSSIHVDLPVADVANVSQTIDSYVGGASVLLGLNFLVPSAGITRESFEVQLEEMN